MFVNRLELSADIMINDDLCQNVLRKVRMYLDFDTEWWG